MRFVLVYKRSSGMRSELHLPDTRMLWRRKKIKKKKKKLFSPPTTFDRDIRTSLDTMLGLEFKGCGEGSFFFVVLFFGNFLF